MRPPGWLDYTDELVLAQPWLLLTGFAIGVWRLPSRWVAATSDEEAVARLSGFGAAYTLFRQRLP